MRVTPAELGVGTEAGVWRVGERPVTRFDESNGATDGPRQCKTGEGCDHQLARAAE